MKFEMYEDKKSLWRWRLKARNGKIIADGSEGYASKQNVKRAVDKFYNDMLGRVDFKVI